MALSRSGLRCGERFRHEYDFTADWTLDIRLEKALPLIQIGLFRYASAEAELRRPKTALEPGIIKSASIVTSISSPIEELGIMAEAMRRFLDSDGNRHAVGDLDELREAVDRVKAYQDFQPGKFDRRKLNRQLRALTQDREVRR